MTGASPPSNTPPRLPTPIRCYSFARPEPGLFMTPLTSLLLPMLVAAIVVFVLSSIIPFAMPWHKNDHGHVPDDAAAQEAIRRLGLVPGDYTVPNPRLPNGERDPDWVKRWEEGPAFVITVIPSGAMNMTKYMGRWFVFTLVVSAISALVAGSIVAPGGSRHAAFHYTAIVTACSYGLGAWPLTIWYHRNWRNALKGSFDAVLYGVATGAVYMMMWPGT